MSDRDRERAHGYHDNDLSYFVRQSPYLAMATPSRAIAFLRRQWELLDDCREALSEYPGLQIEALEFWYTTLRGLGALDLPFLKGLLTRCTWRGVVWRGWLSLMAPRPDFREALILVETDSYRNRWAVELAPGHIERCQPDPDLRELDELCARCRDGLAGVSVVRMPLRPAPSPEQIAARRKLRTKVLELYRAGKTDKALRMLRSSDEYALPMPYEKWYRLVSDRARRSES